MGKTIDFAGIADLFHAAHTKGRNFLFEYEVYTPLACAWAETPPRTVLLPRVGRPSDEELTALPGDRVVLKIVSPSIVHKTEVGGVRIVPKTPDKIRSALRRMLSEVPENYVARMERHPEFALPPTGDARHGISGRRCVGSCAASYWPSSGRRITALSATNSSSACDVPESSVRSSVPTWAAWILSMGMSPPPCPPCCATSQPVVTSPS